MAKISKIPILANPQLIDRVISDIQKGLIANLSWLDYAFGRSQKLTTTIQGNKIMTPTVYAGDKDYIDVSPDAQIGNFCFFTIDDPQTVMWQTKIPGDIEVEYSLIFWFNIDKISGAENRNTEYVKSEILKTLNGKFQLKSGRLNVTKIYEQAENIYRGFTLDEIDNQYLMHPYAGFRFAGNMIINESCYNI